MTATQAGTMSALLGGPGILGVVVLLGYARGVLSRPSRDPRAGWLTFGAGAILVAWFMVFLLLSTSDVIHTWGVDGDNEPEFVLLTATWFVGIGLLLTTLWNARRAARYLSECYRTGEWPPHVRLLRWLFRL
jgi:hypothetical protein